LKIGKEVKKHGKNLSDFYGFGVSIPASSKGAPKFYEKLNTRYDYSSATRGIKSIAQQENALKARHIQ